MSIDKKLVIDNEVFEKLTGEPIAAPVGSENPESEVQARVAMSPSARAALPIAEYLSNQHTGVGFTALMLELNRQADEIAGDDDMVRCQKILASQTLTLDTIFNSLAHRAFAQDRMPQYEAYMKLALKAQAQSRCTMEAISKIKNPPHATFVKQANYAAGHQQVNNGSCPHCEAPSRMKNPETQNPPNELLEAQQGERLDFGAAATPGRTDSEMATVGAVHRAKDEGGEKAS